jgi:hypothetical protein
MTSCKLLKQREYKPEADSDVAGMLELPQHKFKITKIGTNKKGCCLIIRGFKILLHNNRMYSIVIHFVF